MAGLGADLDLLAAEIRAQLADARGERLREGLSIAIVGPPNAGKSSLLNALARREAAIVSATAGTTRDVIEVQLDLSRLSGHGRRHRGPARIAGCDGRPRRDRERRHPACAGARRGRRPQAARARCDRRRSRRGGGAADRCGHAGRAQQDRRDAARAADRRRPCLARVGEDRRGSRRPARRADAGGREAARRPTAKPHRSSPERAIARRWPSAWRRSSARMLRSSPARTRPSLWPRTCGWRRARWAASPAGSASRTFSTSCSASSASASERHCLACIARRQHNLSWFSKV